MKLFIESLGLDPVLSEQGNFPVNPGVGTVDNCLTVVEDKADIFVLIIGARYGFVADRDKSVTNLEFLTARAKGIPVYVFVMRFVLDVLPVWKASPDADFSHVSDLPRLFEFVAGIRDGGGTWVFPFDTAQDIFDVLRAQFAYLFMDALALRMRASQSGGLSAKFRGLSGTALRLVIERPKAWEYLLFGEALSDEVERSIDLKRDWQFGIALGPAGPLLSPQEFNNWIRGKLSEAGRMMASIQSIIDKVLPIAFGPPGVSGDPEAILYAASRLAAAYRSALEWKSTFLRAALPDELEGLRSVASRFCDNMISEVEEFAAKVKDELANAVTKMQSGQPAVVALTLKLTVPDLSELQPELDRVTILIRSGRLNWN